MVNNLAGMRIRQLRSQRKLTQQALADMAEIPRATLATVEKDDANPSLAVVYKIARALGLSIDQLLVTERERIQVVPADQMRWVETADGRYRAVVVSPGNALHFFQQIFSLQAGAVYEGRPHPPGSEEYLHVLEGALELELAGECKRLVKGDSARFGGNVLHQYRNPTEQTVRCLVTILEAVGK
ncbi:transcriptional regulator, XRE family [Magnetococcus marinus MC-1]|uniref:Transcriptional regulator, XRE family n=1 Tax=Magnetococcus marinus (strain ATCC BAA-1437 / JCM 17883 / MC-1) TaxID=156889 RepID=A0L5V7_MAGMM|nr:XRE family transcriptional regulator [Magnetococcus marinus]ABK43350.1 transcriptional regulator, XRE family [Magnetococcus marinus MC-1]